MIPLAWAAFAWEVWKVVYPWAKEKKEEIERPTIRASADDKQFTPGKDKAP